MPRSPLALCLVVALALQGPFIGRAFAQEPSLADKESARDAFAAGMELREKGDKPGALAKFRAAYALVRSPITTLEVGRSYMELGQLIEAREKFLEVGNLPAKTTESKEAKAARVEAEKLADDVGARIPSVLIHVTGAPTGVTPTITIDDAVVPFASLTSPRKINPGKHQLSAKAAGVEPWSSTIEVKEAETKEVTVTLVAIPGAVVPPPPDGPYKPPPPAADTSTGMTTTQILGLGIAGIGGFALGYAVVGGLQARSKWNESEPLCPNDLCEPEGTRLAAEARSQGTTALVVGILGGAALVGGTVLYFAGRPEKKSVGVAATPGSLFLVGQF